MKHALLSFSAALCAFSFVHAESKPGGYTVVEATNKDVAAAAKFAVKEQAKGGNADTKKEKTEPAPKLELIKVLKAKQQIVSGTNFKMELSVKEDGKPRTAEATVWWQPWRKPNPYQLTSWTWK
jgi:hypothetical protein